MKQKKIVLNYIQNIYLNPVSQVIYKIKIIHIINITLIETVKMMIIIRVKITIAI